MCVRVRVCECVFVCVCLYPSAQIIITTKTNKTLMHEPTHPTATLQAFSSRAGGYKGALPLATWWDFDDRT